MKASKPYRIFVTGSGLAASAQEYLLAQHCIAETGHLGDTPEDIAAKRGKTVAEITG